MHPGLAFFKGGEAMQTFMYTIKVPVGLHARHAAIIVKTAKEFESEITVSLDDRDADAKRILGLMGLGVKQGDVIKVEVEGPDEDVAALKLKSFLWETF